MPKARVVPLFEEKAVMPNGTKICLQYARYEYEDGSQDTAFRFIGRQPDTNNMKAQRGQCGVNLLDEVEGLIKKAREAGWGHYKGTMYRQG